MSRQNVAVGNNEKKESSSATVRPVRFRLSMFSMHSSGPNAAQHEGSVIMSGWMIIGMSSPMQGSKAAAAPRSVSDLNLLGTWTDLYLNLRRSSDLKALMRGESS